MNNDRDKRIEERIKVKDRREDTRQTSITVSWSINAAIASLNEPDVATIEERARQLLALYDVLVDERSGVPSNGEERAL